MADLPHVVILGAGFGGIGAAQELREAAARITIVDQNDYHAFQPLLYQVATDELGASEVGYPVRELLHRHANFDFHRCAARSIDLAKKQVVADGIAPLRYDYLVLAMGAVVNYHGTPGAAEHSIPLYTLRDAVRLHDQILNMFEAADRNPASVDDGTLTFCIVGGGPTGTELAGAMSELLHTELAEDYPNLSVEKVRIILYEHSPHLLAAFKPKLRDYAQRELKNRGVEVHTEIGVSAVRPTEITLSTGEVIKTRTLIWAAGLAANPITAALGVELGPGGRVPVGSDLQLNDHPGTFALGDIAAMTDAKFGKALPGLGAVALQAGRHAGKSIARLIAGKPAEPFHYIDKGTMAQIGRGAAVVELPTGGTLTGRVAWLAWLGVHLSLLSGAEEKTSVFVDWGWNLLTHKRGKRIVLSDEDAATDGTGQ
jgi:NADH:quinone reductase (non-electrogenic)